jgi:hypothetical protein
VSWVRLEVGNDWGQAFYTYPGERLNATGTNETDNALVLCEGMTTAVRFPDDWGAVVDLSSRPERFSYSDMGREHSGTTKRWGFEWDVHGLKVWIPIESVDVCQGFASRRREVREDAPHPSEPAAGSREPSP